MQNWNCKQSSTWDTILEHSDFKKLPKPNLSKPIKVAFDMVQQKEKLTPRIVLVLDVSGSMRKNDRLNELIKGATSYVQNIQDNSRRLAIVTFSTNATTVRKLMLVNGTTRREYLDDIKKLAADGWTCIGCGLECALKELNSSNESTEDGGIVLVTDGEENREPWIREVLPKLVQAKVVVSTVGIISHTDKQLEELASTTGGKAFALNDRSWPRHSLLEEIFESTAFPKKDNNLHWKVTWFRDDEVVDASKRSLTDCEEGTETEVHTSKNNPGTVEARLIDSSDWRCKDCHIADGTGHKHILIPTAAEHLMKRKQKSAHTIEIFFYVDIQSINRTEVIMRKHHPDNITVRLVQPSGQPCNKCNITYDGNNTLICLPTPAEVGNWTVYVSSSVSKSELRPQTRMRSRVTITDKTAVVRCEVDWKVDNPEDAVIYATFTQGNKVFKDAVVYAEVSAPEPLENSTMIRLYDDHRIPDIRRDDGTYTGYFSQFSGRGKYIVKVRVRTQNTTRLGRPWTLHSSADIYTHSEDGYIELSLDPPPKPVDEPAPLLFLEEDCGYFSVGTDMFYWQLPPGYVPDLRVTSVVRKPNATLLVQLTWTWPGAHMYFGNATGVTIRASEDFDQLKQNFDNQVEITSADVVEGNLDPLPPGAKHVVTISLPATFGRLQSDGEYNWTAFIAIRVTNSYGLSSETSWVADATQATGPVVFIEETGVTVRTDTGVTVKTETGVTVTTKTTASTKFQTDITNEGSEDEDSGSSALFSLIWVGIVILVVGAVVLAIYTMALKKRIEENTPDEPTGPTSKSKEETATETVG